MIKDLKKLNISKIDICYIAGLFDGDGTVTFGETKQLQMAIANDYKSVIRWIANVLGLGFYIDDYQRADKRYNFMRRGKEGWRAQASGKRADRALKTILPYLKIKKAIVQECLDKYESYGK